MRHDTRKPVILATGFSVFPGAPDNPTAWAIGELERARWQPDGAMLCTHVLPVRHDVWSEIEPLLAHEMPDAVVAFGLSAKATGFTLESTARNQLGLGRPDAAGELAPTAHLIEGGSATYASGLPLKDIERVLARNGLPFAPSDDAGDYICNLMFYRLMKQRLETGAPRIAGFIHVPYLQEQLPVLERAGLPTSHLRTMTRSQLLQGMRAIITEVAASLRSASAQAAS